MANVPHEGDIEAISGRVRRALRDVEGFPKPGIIFKDITPMLSDSALFIEALDAMAALVGETHADKVVCVDARGFIFGAPIAERLHAGLVPVRKAGKLPWDTHSLAYTLEYGENVVEIHQDAVRPGERVVLIDDLLATGGTAHAANQLVKRMGGELIANVFLIELEFLGGRSVLEADAPVRSLVSF